MAAEIQFNKETSNFNTGADLKSFLQNFNSLPQPSGLHPELPYNIKNKGDQNWINTTKTSTSPT